MLSIIYCIAIATLLRTTMVMVMVMVVVEINLYSTWQSLSQSAADAHIPRGRVFHVADEADVRDTTNNRSIIWCIKYRVMLYWN